MAGKVMPSFQHRIERKAVKNMSESREEMLHSTAKAREQVMIDRLLESFYKHKDEILKATQEKKD